MRIMLHPDYLDSPTLARLSRPAADYWHRILLASADAHGCFKVNPRTIYGCAFPQPERYPDVTEANVAAWLDEYQQAGLLGVWQDEGRLYGYWIAWQRYNRVRGHYTRKTPEPPDTFTFTSLSIHLPFTSDHSAFTFDSLSTTSASTPTPTPTPTPTSTTTRKPSSLRNGDGVQKSDAGFGQFWERYPKKRNKADALKAWKKTMPPLVDVLQALEWQIRSADWTKDQGQFIPYPATYIRAGGWEAEPDKAPTPERTAPSSPRCDCGHTRAQHRDGRCLPSCDCMGYAP